MNNHVKLFSMETIFLNEVFKTRLDITNKELQEKCLTDSDVNRQWKSEMDENYSWLNPGEST